MSKCDCYHTRTKRQYTYNPMTGDPIGHNIGVGVCWGTKECEECSCGGDRTNCDFYPEVRERALKERNPKCGEWILVYDGLDFANFECSICHDRTDVNGKYDIEDYRYCKHCGTKMKKWR